MKIAEIFIIFLNAVVFAVDIAAKVVIALGALACVRLCGLCGDSFACLVRKRYRVVLVDGEGKSYLNACGDKHFFGRVLGENSRGLCAALFAVVEVPVFVVACLYADPCNS